MLWQVALLSHICFFLWASPHSRCSFLKRMHLYVHKWIDTASSSLTCRPDIVASAWRIHCLEALGKLYLVASGEWGPRWRVQPFIHVNAPQGCQVASANPAPLILRWFHYCVPELPSPGKAAFSSAEINKWKKRHYTAGLIFARSHRSEAWTDP